MDEFLNSVLIKPIQRPEILWLTIAYLFAASITTYDIRLIQHHSRDFRTGVSMDAGGRMLPSWVGYFAIIQWLIFIAIVVLDWKFAIALFVLKFVLKVLPVLENIGSILMSPFLKDNW